MKDWSEYTEEDCEALYDGTFNLEAVLNGSEDAPKTPASTESEQVTQLREQLEEMKAALQERLLHDELVQAQLKKSQELNEKLLKDLRSERGHKQVLLTVNGNLKIRMEQQFEIIEGLKKEKEDSVSLKAALEVTQEELKRQVEINDNLKKDLRKERGHKEVLQTVQGNLKNRLQQQYDVTGELQKEMENKKVEIESIKTETKKLQERFDQQLLETNQLREVLRANDTKEDELNKPLNKPEGMKPRIRSVHDLKKEHDLRLREVVRKAEVQRGACVNEKHNLKESLQVTVDVRQHSRAAPEKQVYVYDRRSRRRF